MYITSKIETPDDVAVTMRITMTLREWQMVAEQLMSTKYPSMKFRDALLHMIKARNSEMTKTFEELNEKT